jgi:hypothetical protein
MSMEINTGSGTAHCWSPCGASVDSRFFYARTEGELERDVQAIGFQSLAIVRQSMIGGRRNERRLGESVVLHISKVLGPLPPPDSIRAPTMSTRSWSSAHPPPAVTATPFAAGSSCHPAR